MTRAESLASTTALTGTGTVPDPQEVLVQTGRWINRTAWRLHYRMPWTEVDDMVQHGLLTALELRERYEPQRSVPFALFVKPRVMGAMIDISRREGALKRREEAYAAEADTSVPDETLDLIIRCEDTAALAEEIDLLPQEERHAISLFYLEEMRNKDVARIMGITEVRALRLRARAMERLAQGLRARMQMTQTHTEDARGLRT